MQAYTRKSHLKDIQPVANAMRQEDVAELAAGSGNSPAESLLYCFFHSVPCMTMVSANDRPMGMWGVVPEEDGLGRIWMLGTDEMVDHGPSRIRFLRESPKFLAAAQAKYPVLYNYVDARNTIHVKWLRWMGFTFLSQHPNYGQEGRLFLEFARLSHV